MILEVNPSSVETYRFKVLDSLLKVLLARFGVVSVKKLIEDSKLAALELHIGSFFFHLFLVVLCLADQLFQVAYLRLRFASMV